MIENIVDFEKAETKRLLNKYGIPVNWLGYKYLVTAVPYAIEKICANEKVVLGELYKFVARKHKTTSNKVLYAIRCLYETSDIASKMECEKVTNQTLIISLAMILIEKLNL